MRFIYMTFVALAVSAVAAGASAQSTVVQQAQNWLHIVDQFRFNESWSAAGDVFKMQVGRSRWAEQMTGLRAPLGDVVARTFKGEQRSDSLPGAPDGHYEVIQFSSTFARKMQATETVILAEQADGWRVDGYFIR